MTGPTSLYFYTPSQERLHVGRHLGRYGVARAKTILLHYLSTTLLAPILSLHVVMTCKRYLGTHVHVCTHGAVVISPDGVFSLIVQMQMDAHMLGRSSRFPKPPCDRGTSTYQRARARFSHSVSMYCMFPGFGMAPFYTEIPCRCASVIDIPSFTELTMQLPCHASPFHDSETHAHAPAFSPRYHPPSHPVNDNDPTSSFPRTSTTYMHTCTCTQTSRIILIVIICFTFLHSNHPLLSCTTSSFTSNTQSIAS